MSTVRAAICETFGAPLRVEALTLRAPLRSSARVPALGAKAAAPPAIAVRSAARKRQPDA